MKTLKEKAKEIRGILKEKGIKASVRMRSGSAISIYIQDLGADYEAVREVAQSFENIRRCEYTHEILSGGNDFVFVSYDYDVLRESSKNYIELAEQYLTELAEMESNYLLTIAERGTDVVLLAPDPDGPTLILNNNNRQRDWKHTAHCKESLAEGLAILDARYEFELVA